MLGNDQTYFKNLAVLTPQDFEDMFGHFSILCMKRLALMQMYSSELIFSKCLLWQKE